MAWSTPCAEIGHHKKLRLKDLSNAAAHHVIPVGICMVSAFAISFIPIVIWRHIFHHWIYLADNDNILYLQLAAQSYYRHAWYLPDPVNPGYESYFPFLIYGPTGVLARLIGLNVFDITIIWHIWSAVGFALGLYAFFYCFSGHKWTAAASSVFAMANCGLIVGDPLFRHLFLLSEVLSGSTGTLFHEWPPVFLKQWRIVDPALGLPFLLLHIVALRMAHRRATTLRIAAAGLSFGLLVYVYFYFWTAAACGLALSFAFDGEKRRVYASSFSIGFLSGAPILLNQMMLRASSSPDALPRNSYFLFVPHFGNLTLPNFTILLLLLSGVWIWMKGRYDAIYLWSLAVAGLALANSHVLTGIELEARHWRMVWGPATGLLVIIIATDFMSKWIDARAELRWLAVGTVGAFLFSALYLQRVETLNTDEAKVTMKAYQQFETAEPELRSLSAGSVVAGENRICELTTIASNTRPLYTYVTGLSLWMDNHEWETRNALNGYLSGLDHNSFRDYARDFAANRPIGPWSVYDRQKALLQTQLDQLFDLIQQNPQSYIERFKVRYVLLLADQKPPAYLASGWRRIAVSPGVQVWVIVN
jgi:hypothetical protein